MSFSDKTHPTETDTSAPRPEGTAPHPIIVVMADGHGFTLVELLVVTAILGVLFAIGMSSFTGFKENARRGRCIAEVRGIERDIDGFALQNIRLPDDLGEIGKAGMVDPWGRPYVYNKFVAGAMREMGPDLNEDYDLYSLGKDGLSDLSILDGKSEDDIIRAGNGGFVGTAKDYGTP